MQRRTRIKRRVIKFRRRNSFGPRLQVVFEREHTNSYEYMANHQKRFRIYW